MSHQRINHSKATVGCFSTWQDHMSARIDKWSAVDEKNLFRAAYELFTGHGRLVLARETMSHRLGRGRAISSLTLDLCVALGLQSLYLPPDHRIFAHMISVCIRKDSIFTMPRTEDGSRTGFSPRHSVARRCSAAHRSEHKKPIRSEIHWNCH